MIDKLTRKYKLLRNIFSNVLYYARKTKTGYAETPGTAYALVNLDDKIMNQSGGRFFYLLCKYFEQAGFKVVVSTNLFFYLALHPYKKLLLNRNYLLVRKMATPKNTIVVKSNGKEQIISIMHGLNTIAKNTKQYSLPFPMHPVQVDAFNKTIINNLRNEKKAIRILFSGSWTQDQYKVPLTDYNVLTRAEVIRSIIDRFNDKDLVRLVSARDELTTLLQSQQAGKQIIISEVKTKDEDWMPLLSLTDFFISPPGFKYPWCHNSIEAMAVGAIPILQYNNLFVPELVHMENCLCFSNTSELEAAINAALTLPVEEIIRLRKNVIAYYDQHLSPNAIVKKIKDFTATGESKLEMAMPYIN